MNDLMWRKSIRSGTQGVNCVEIAGVPGGALVRDSKDPEGARLGLSGRQWRGFLVGLKAGDYDR